MGREFSRPILFWGERNTARMSEMVFFRRGKTGFLCFRIVSFSPQKLTN